MERTEINLVGVTEQAKGRQVSFLSREEDGWFRCWRSSEGYDAHGTSCELRDCRWVLEVLEDLLLA